MIRPRNRRPLLAVPVIVDAVSFDACIRNDEGAPRENVPGNP